MKLSPPQVQLFWREWAAACRVMNWTRNAGLTAAEIDAHRKEFLGRCGFASLTVVDRVAGFTVVLNELKILQGASLRAAQETVDPSLNEARVLCHLILTELIPCLELYVADVRAYLVEVLAHQPRLMRELDLPHLTVAELTRLRFTITARLNARRKEAGDTIHTMKKRAGVPCGCAQCRRPVCAASFIAPLTGPAELVKNPF